jgi:hypothetical protein
MESSWQPGISTIPWPKLRSHHHPHPSRRRQFPHRRRNPCRRRFHPRSSQRHLPPLSRPSLSCLRLPKVSRSRRFRLFGKHPFPRRHRNPCHRRSSRRHLFPPYLLPRCRPQGRCFPRSRKPPLLGRPKPGRRPICRSSGALPPNRPRKRPWLPSSCKPPQRHPSPRSHPPRGPFPRRRPRFKSRPPNQVRPRHRRSAWPSSCQRLRHLAPSRFCRRFPPGYPGNGPARARAYTCSADPRGTTGSA